LQEFTIRQQEEARPQEETQTTRGDSDKYTDTKPSVIEKELAEGQLYQLQKFTIRQQEKARPEEEPQRSTQTNSGSDRQEDLNFLSFQSLMGLVHVWVVGSGHWFSFF
jgi:hypothetical protein